MSSDWSREEVELIVADHLQMLTLELAGQSYSKAAHRRNLQRKLHGRSDGSIEFKHCNISAILIHLGRPYIRGYQPRGNFRLCWPKWWPRNCNRIPCWTKQCSPRCSTPPQSP